MKLTRNKKSVIIVLTLGLMAQVKDQEFEISGDNQINLREVPRFKDGKIAGTAKKGDLGVIKEIQTRTDGRTALRVSLKNGLEGWILYSRQDWILLKSPPDSQVSKSTEPSVQPTAQPSSTPSQKLQEVQEVTQANYVMSKKDGVQVYASVEGSAVPYGSLGARKAYEIDQDKWDSNSDWVPLKAVDSQGKPITLYLKKNAELVVGKINDLLKALNPAEAACQEVPVASVPANLEFEACHEIKAQFAEALAEREKFKRPSAAEVLKSELAACILASQKGEASHSFQYLSCRANPNGGWTSTKSKSNRPCVAPSVTAVVAGELQEVSDCLNTPTNELFSMYNHESRFMPNARSGTGAAGITQLINAAITDVVKPGGIAARSVIPNGPSYASLGDQNKESCKRIKNRVTNAPNPGDDCDYAWGSQNPLRNLAVGTLFYLHNKKICQELVQEWLAAWKEIDKTIDADPKLLQHIARDLAVWMHNGGTGGIRSRFKAWMMKRPPNMTVITVKRGKPEKEEKFAPLDLSIFQKEFSNDLKASYKPGDSDRREEVGNYIPHVYRDRDKINRETGKSCGI